jgi:hypothetical protein
MHLSAPALRPPLLRQTRTHTSARMPSPPSHNPSHAVATPLCYRCVDDHEGCTSWARGGECKSNPLFMHTHCAVACGSCNKPIDSILSTEAEMHMGDWRAKEETQRKHQLGEALEYIPSAEIEEIEKLEAAIAERREVLAMKHEL